MSAKLNKIQIIGRLGKDPEMSFKGKDSDLAVTKMSVAANRKRDKDVTDWFNVVAFGQAAEFANQYGSKGRLVYIEGEMRNNRWEDEDGNTRDWWEIAVNDFQFLDYVEE